MKATITFTDKPDGQVDVQTVFDPPLGKAGHTESEAQIMCLNTLTALVKAAGDDVEKIERMD